MVTEAVGEMKGEPQPPKAAEIKLDVPTDAFLPTDYVAKEELRLEAYRRLAAVTSAAEVDDIRTEWEDRYGPLPEPAGALLQVGYLRAECHRLGITDIQIASGSNTTNTAKLSPLTLKTQRDDAPAADSPRRRSTRRTSRQLVVPIPPRRRAVRVPRAASSTS